MTLWGSQMADNRAELVGVSFCDVLEKLAFMFAEPTPKEELPRSVPASVQARMTFSGDLAGSLALTVPEAMCTDIAANVLGMDAGDESVLGRTHDALKEVLNVVCGYTLTAIGGEAALVDLSVPHVTELDETGWATVLADRDSAGFVLDEGPVLLQLRLSEDVP